MGPPRSTSRFGGHDISPKKLEIDRQIPVSLSLPLSRGFLAQFSSVIFQMRTIHSKCSLILIGIHCASYSLLSKKIYPINSPPAIYLTVFTSPINAPLIDGIKIYSIIACCSSFLIYIFIHLIISMFFYLIFVEK